MRTIHIQFENWRELLWCKKNNISISVYMRKVYLRKILEIQMLIYPTLSPYFPATMDLRSNGKMIFQKFLEILSAHWHFGGLQTFHEFSGQLGLEWETAEITR